MRTENHGNCALVVFTLATAFWDDGYFGGGGGCVIVGLRR